MTPFRWGILSTARVNRHFVPRMREGRHRLVAVASRTQARADAYAREWAIPRAHGSYESLLASDDVDGVYISLPNSAHAEWTIKAVEHGKHVLCEKPLAITVAEVDAMAEAAARYGRVVSEGIPYRHHPQAARIRDLVQQGAIGEPRLVRSVFTYSQSRDGDVRLDPALGGGSLWDVGCYPLGLVRMVLGAEPETVCAWQHLGPTGVDEQVSAMLRFGCHVVAHVDCGFRAAYRTAFDIAGTEATLVVPSPFKPRQREELRLIRNDREDLVVVDGPPLYGGELDDLAAAALDGAPQAVTLADSRENVRVILACLRSATLGTSVGVAGIA